MSRVRFAIVVVTATAVCLAGGTLRAQPLQYYSNQPVWSSNTSRVTRSIAVGDVDRDGFVDVVFGNEGGRNTLYMGVSDALRGGPTWEGAATDSTESVALGDINGDGFLDLVCGKQGRPNALYLGNGRVFSDVPDWTSGTVNNTFGVALADLNNDGQLDLVCANENQPNTVYFNIGGTFSTVTDWSSTESDRSIAVAVGDINNDTFLDLVFANDGLANTLYLGGPAGAIGTSLAWASGLTRRSFDVAIGDIDGDGALDLVFGNVTNNTVYFNVGGLPELAPSWESAASYVTAGIDLGDVDTDGDLDLICGNFNAGNALYLNTGSTLAVTPVWVSATTNQTFAVALADFGRDGDLDLICGNESQVNSLFSASGVVMEKNPSWLSTDATSTFGVAVGDVDNDDDLDLVCANGGFFGQPNTVYYNTGQGLETTPSWYSGPAEASFGIALGDINSDGYLDIVVANAGTSGQRNSLYLNDGAGSFETQPAWRSSLSNNSIVVALGDIDRDGDLDVAFGNGGIEGEPNTIYINRNGVLDTIPSWTSSLLNITVGVAFGDIDGDGNLDLACGNNGQANTIYHGNGFLLDDPPAWVAAQANNTFGVAVGDLDGDRDDDLVCGNGGFVDQGNTLYANSGSKGFPPTTPIWTSDALGSSTFGVVMGDPDGDGDLDIFAGNESQGNTLHLQQPLTSPSTPAWVAASKTSTFGVTVGDIDGDGDFDLVCGNEAQPNEVYNSLVRPAFRGDPLNPTRQLANNPAYIKQVRVTRDTLNVFHVQFRGVDLESDSFYIRAEYQHRGEPAWLPAQIATTPDGLAGAFGASPAGVVDSFQWDYSRIDPDPRAVILRLSVMSYSHRVAKGQWVTAYMKDMGTIDPIVPQLIAPTSITFPTVTVGDTVVSEIFIRNSGRATLSVPSIGLPTDEITLNPPPPFDVVPGGLSLVLVSLEPRRGVAVTGAIVLNTNDPGSPTFRINVITDIKPLAVVTDLLVPAFEQLPLGEAVTARVTAATGVRVERAILFHRPTGTGAFQDSIVMSPVIPPTPPPPGPTAADRVESVAAAGGELVKEWIGVIPGTAVTERGLDYYVRVENSGVTATDPAGAPVSFYSEVVKAPQSITTLPVATDGPDFAEGRDIRVLVDVPQGAVVVSGELHYRSGGERIYSDTPIEPGEPLPSATIPGSLVGPQGVEYWAEVNTLSNGLTDGTSTAPLSLRVVVSNLREPSTHSGKQYRMASVPLVMSPGVTFAAILSDQSAFGPYDRTRWRNFRWDPTALGYEELSDTASSVMDLQPGRGFWLISSSQHRVDSAPVRAFSTPANVPYAVTLSPGWSQIANPFNFVLAWDSSRVNGQPVAGANVQGPIRYDPSSGEYDPTPAAFLTPFDGYWVKNLETSNVTLELQPEATLLPVPLATAPNGEGATTVPSSLQLPAGTETPKTGQWHIRVMASCDGVSDSYNNAIVDASANDGWDALDLAEPPMAPGRSLSVYFPHADWGLRSDRYGTDARADDAASTGGHSWTLDVAKSFSMEPVGDEVILTFDGVESVPRDMEVRLVDHDLQRSVDLRAEPRYGFRLGVRGPGVGGGRFTLVAGTPEFVATSGQTATPTQTALRQNRPNPFNPTTVIRFDLAQSAPVALVVYNVDGRRVRQLLSQPLGPGGYEVPWDGRNDSGAPVASGVYFYRLTAGDYSATRKMILLK